MLVLRQVPRSVLLIAAFSALLLVIGGSSVAVWVGARNAQNRVADLHGGHVKAGAALSALRANVYLTGILTRDYLLDPEPMSVDDYSRQFDEIRSSTEDAFRILAGFAQDRQQHEALDRLRKELDAYWDPLEVALDWSAEEKRTNGYRLLRQRVRRREEIFALARQVEGLMGDNFDRERARITSADRDFRNTLGWITGLAMLFGVGIAAATLSRMISLERQSRLAESELRRLSGQIRTAQEQERKYLSRELHDQVGQMLTGLRMELASMARVHADSESELSARIARSKTTVEQTLRIVRDIAMLLRPSMLDDLGLVPALLWLVKEVSRSSGMDIRAEIEPEADLLPDSHRTCLYRVVQEALTNCSRHSAAKRVDVSVKVSGGTVVAVVTDDGRGFDTAVTMHNALGLLGMEERVRELGGSVRVVSSPGHGTRIEILLPRPAAEEGSHDPDSDRGRSRDRSDRIETPA